jgi:cytochrome P450
MPSIGWTAVLPLIGYVVYTTYTNRARINRLRKAGYVSLVTNAARKLLTPSQPMPPWNWVFGHLLVLKKYTDRHPADTFITTSIRDMARDFPETDMFYLDLWPFTTPVLCVCEADAANQATTKNPFPKADSFNVVFEPIMGGPNLLSMNNQTWKEWRALLNPGFGSGYIQDLVPVILDNIEVFCSKLQERAGTIFCIEELVTRMTMDIIVKVTL